MILDLNEWFIPRLRALFMFLVTGIRFRRVGAHAKLLGLQRTSFGRRVSVGDFCWIQAIHKYGGMKHTPVLSISDDVSISDLTHISCVHKISIGAGSLLGSKIYIGDHSHGSMRNPLQFQSMAPADRPLDDIDEIFIGRRVWIGDGAVVLGGTRIADGSVIGANSVVKLRTDRPALIGGAPARVIRYLDDQGQ
jgi:acetyltransferase-like isoleucine patch superfamily enzyme